MRKFFIITTALLFSSSAMAQSLPASLNTKAEPLNMHAMGLSPKSTTWLLPTGLLSTKGNQIVDANGNPVRIVSVSAVNDVNSLVSAIVNAGFNTLRVQWGNSDLTKNGFTILDKIVNAAKTVGLKVILVNQYNEGVKAPCTTQQANGLWYDSSGASNNTDGCGTKGTITDAKFLSDWQSVATHYHGNNTVIGFDLRNEPLASSAMSTWEAGNANPNHNLRYMYERVGNAILKIDPDKLIICEGPLNPKSDFAGNGIAPWGDLSTASKLPPNLTHMNKLVFSVHDFPNEISKISPDNGPQKVTSMNNSWGYLVTQNLYPVWLGAMGSNMASPTDTFWAQTLQNYANGLLYTLNGPKFTGNQQGISINWWWAGHANNTGVQPSGIFLANGSINNIQAAVWNRFEPIAATIATPTIIESPNNTVIKGGSTAIITDAKGNKWGINSSKQITINDKADTTTANVTQLAYVNGNVWQENSNNLWWSKTSPTAAWSPTNGTSTSPLPITKPTPVPDPTPTPSGVTPIKAPLSSATPGNWTTATINGMTYGLLLPSGYNTKYSYPAILYLHQLDNGSYGWATLQNQINGWFNTVSFRQNFPAIIVAPLCDQNADLSGNTINWGGVSNNDGGCGENAITIFKSVIKQYSSNSKKLYVTGNSMGGIGSWEMAIQYNYQTGTLGHLFTAAMPLAGATYNNGYPTPNANVVAALKNYPIFAYHGSQDTTVPLDWDRNMYSAQQKQGGIEKYNELSGLGHDVWDTVYPKQSTWQWLFSQTQ